MKVKHLIAKLENLISTGHGDDDVIMAQKYDNGYIYQNIFTVVQYDGEYAVGLVGKGLIEDRRDKEDGLVNEV